MSAGTSSPHTTGPPLAVASLGIATFATMDAVMKSLTLELGAYNTLLWRTLLAVSMAAVLFVLTRNPWPERRVLRLHVWRGLVTSGMGFLFFWGLAYVPLAEAIALSFIAPLIALYLAAALLGEQVGGKAVLASVIGLAGALVIIAGRLGGDYGDNADKGIAAILLSAVIYSYNLILQRQQAIVAGPIEIVFFQYGTTGLVFLLFAPLLAEAPPLELVPALGIAAGLAILSVMMLSWAYARAEAKILIPIEYTRIYLGGPVGLADVRGRGLYRDPWWAPG